MNNNDDFVLYYSQLWLNEVINSNGCKNEHELYVNTLCDTSSKNKK
jgi:hypothetical protein